MNNSSFNNSYNNDPSSLNYKRVLTYPKINWKKILLEFILFSIFLVIITLITYFFIDKYYLKIIIPIIYILFYAAIRLKAIILFLIALYQLIAPKKLRMNCRFEPSCSEYMKLAIIKYGLFKGLKKGINRLKRCKYPNGGYDYP